MGRYYDQLRRIVKEYIRAGMEWPASTRQIASWAIDKGLWKPQASAFVDQCAEVLARAMREEYIIDPQGRTVRVKHVARTKRGGAQLSLWADIRTAPREHMEIAFQQRRQQVVGDCRQLKADIDSFNENRSPLRPIQMSFDFTVDLEELEAVAALRQADLTDSNEPVPPASQSRTAVPL